MSLFARCLTLVCVLVALTGCGRSNPAQATPQAATAAPSLRPQAVASALRNPLVGRGSPDPFITYWNGNYYMTYTTGDVRIRTAPSLAGLWKAPETVVWTDSTASRCCNLWAPELYRLAGPNGTRWYVYYTAGNSGNLDGQRTYVLESSGDNPLGPYSFKGRLFDSAHDFWAIDSTLLQQGSSLYLLWSGHPSGGDNTQNIYIAPMSNPWTISGSRVQLSTPQYDWEKAGAPPTVNEGPEVLRHAGKFFVTFSASGCWTDDYKLGMLSVPDTANVLSAANWTKQSTPVFTRNDAGGAFGPGHNGFFKSPDGSQDWIVYHANATPGLGCNDYRMARAQRVNYNGDGTPNFGAPLSLQDTTALPAGDPGFNFDAPVAGATYRLINQQSGLCLDVAGGSAAQKTNVQTYTCNNLAPQNWKLTDAGNGFFSLVSQVGDGNTYCLDIDGGNTAPGTNVQIWNCNSQWPQRWKFVDLNGGVFKLVNDTPGGSQVALDSVNGGVTPGTNVATYTQNGLAPQNWRLERR